MEDLKIVATRDTPGISFDHAANTLVIEGKSFPEDTFSFYSPVMSWLQRYLDTLQDGELTVNLDLKYINSSSSKLFMNMFELFDKEAASGKKIVINWFYDADDEDASEEGEDFSFDLEAVTFNIVEKS